MITLSRMGNDHVVVSWEPRYSARKLAFSPGRAGGLTWMDYNPLKKRLSNSRSIKYKMLGTMQQLSDMFSKYPDARIRNILAHEPYINDAETQQINAQLRTIQDVAAWKRVQKDGVDVIDEFGFHVYIRSELDLTGDLEDIDSRYQPEP